MALIAIGLTALFFDCLLQPAIAATVTTAATTLRSPLLRLGVNQEQYGNVPMLANYLENPGFEGGQNCHVIIPSSANTTTIVDSQSGNDSALPAGTYSICARTNTFAGNCYSTSYNGSGTYTGTFPSGIISTATSTLNPDLFTECVTSLTNGSFSGMIQGGWHASDLLSAAQAYPDNGSASLAMNIGDGSTHTATQFFDGQGGHVGTCHSDKRTFCTSSDFSSVCPSGASDSCDIYQVIPDHPVAGAMQAYAYVKTTGTGGSDVVTLTISTSRGGTGGWSTSHAFTVTLDGAWHQYVWNFTGADTGAMPQGSTGGNTLSVAFSLKDSVATTGAVGYLDHVYFGPASPGVGGYNPAVIQTLQTLNPGTYRHMQAGSMSDLNENEANFDAANDWARAPSWSWYETPSMNQNYQWPPPVSDDWPLVNSLGAGLHISMPNTFNDADLDAFASKLCTNLATYTSVPAVFLESSNEEWNHSANGITFATLSGGSNMHTGGSWPAMWVRNFTRIQTDVAANCNTQTSKIFYIVGGQLGNGGTYGGTALMPNTNQWGSDGATYASDNGENVLTGTSPTGMAELSMCSSALYYNTSSAVQTLPNCTNGTNNFSTSIANGVPSTMTQLQSNQFMAIYETGAGWYHSGSTATSEQLYGINEGWMAGGANALTWLLGFQTTPPLSEQNVFELAQVEFPAATGFAPLWGITHDMDANFGPTWATNGGHIRPLGLAVALANKAIQQGGELHQVTGLPNGVFCDAFRGANAGNWSLWCANMNATTQSFTVAFPASGTVPNACYALLPAAGLSGNPALLDNNENSTDITIGNCPSAPSVTGQNVTVNAMQAFGAYVLPATTTPTPVALDETPLTDGCGTNYTTGSLSIPKCLYANGSNLAPGATHSTAALSHIANIQKLDTNGNPSSSGKIVVGMMGMSISTDVACGYAVLRGLAPSPCEPNSFMGESIAGQSTGLVNPNLTFVDFAQYAQGPSAWAQPRNTACDNGPAGNIANCTSPWDTVLGNGIAGGVPNRLTQYGISANQVQVMFIMISDQVKTANLLPLADLGHAWPCTAADTTIFACVQETQMGATLRNIKTYFPNIQVVYLVDVSYGGFDVQSINANDPTQGLLPDQTFNGIKYAYGYEWGLTNQHIEACQEAQADAGGAACNSTGSLAYSVAPLILRGPYTWTRNCAFGNDASGQCTQGTGIDYLPLDGRHPCGLSTADSHIACANSTTTTGLGRLADMMIGWLEGNGLYNGTRYTFNSNATYSQWYLGSPAGAITFIQQVKGSNTSAGTQLSLNLPANSTAGDTLLLAVDQEPTSVAAAPSVSVGTTLATPILLTTSGSSGGQYTSSIYAIPVTSSGPAPVSVTPGGGGGFITANLSEWSNLSTTVDGVASSATSTGGPYSSVTTPNITTANSNDLILAIGGPGGTSTVTITDPANPPWTALTGASGTGNGLPVAGIVYQITSAPQTNLNASFNFSATGSTIGSAIVALQAAGTSPPPPPITLAGGFTGQLGIPYSEPGNIVLGAGSSTAVRITTSIIDTASAIIPTISSILARVTGNLKAVLNKVNATKVAGGLAISRTLSALSSAITNRSISGIVASATIRATQGTLTATTRIVHKFTKFITARTSSISLSGAGISALMSISRTITATAAALNSSAKIILARSAAIAVIVHPAMTALITSLKAAISSTIQATQERLLFSAMSAGASINRAITATVSRLGIAQLKILRAISATIAATKAGLTITALTLKISLNRSITAIRALIAPTQALRLVINRIVSASVTRLTVSSKSIAALNLAIGVTAQRIIGTITTTFGSIINLTSEIVTAAQINPAVKFVLGVNSTLQATKAQIIAGIVHPINLLFTIMASAAPLTATVQAALRLTTALKTIREAVTATAVNGILQIVGTLTASAHRITALVRPRATINLILAATQANFVIITSALRRLIIMIIATNARISPLSTVTAFLMRGIAAVRTQINTSILLRIQVLLQLVATSARILVTISFHQAINLILTIFTTAQITSTANVIIPITRGIRAVAAQIIVIWRIIAAIPLAISALFASILTNPIRAIAIELTISAIRTQVVLLQIVQVLFTFGIAATNETITIAQAIQLALRFAITATQALIQLILSVFQPTPPIVTTIQINAPLAPNPIVINGTL